ncbi:hypothetical protein H9P43_007345 [Blastocladiella emersonii ATCC 22665]|nr:hypothetical protein H9P43_007345 [Blastocladiella emersonii ATCC 22665]
MFGFIDIDINLRPGAQWHVTTENGAPSENLEYALTNCELQFEEVELSPQINAA